MIVASAASPTGGRKLVASRLVSSAIRDYLGGIRSDGESVSKSVE